jgi:hypothetical protein
MNESAESCLAGWLTASEDGRICSLLSLNVKIHQHSTSQNPTGEKVVRSTYKKEVEEKHQS